MRNKSLVIILPSTDTRNGKIIYSLRLVFLRTSSSSTFVRDSFRLCLEFHFCSGLFQTLFRVSVNFGRTELSYLYQAIVHDSYEAQLRLAAVAIYQIARNSRIV